MTSVQKFLLKDLRNSSGRTEAGIGKTTDWRCSEALDMLQSKQLPDGGFPLERKNCKISDTIITRDSFADWSKSGKKKTNPFVTFMLFMYLSVQANLYKLYNVFKDALKTESIDEVRKYDQKISIYFNFFYKYFSGCSYCWL